MLHALFQMVVDTLLGAGRDLRNGYYECVKRRFAVRPLEESQWFLNDWWQSERGRALLASESAAVDACLSGLHGNYMMVVALQALPAPESCRVQNYFSLSPAGGNSVSARANLEQLPLSESVIDVAVLQHTLEYSLDPHQFLREVDRVLTPHGHLVVVAFNPLSLTGIYSSVMRFFSSSAHRRHHSLRRGRVRDWLRLLNFETQSIPCFRYHSWRPQSLIMRAFKRIAEQSENFGLPLSSYYVIVAQKRVTPLTPSKPSWLPLPSVSRFAADPFVGNRASRAKRHKFELNNGQ